MAPIKLISGAELQLLHVPLRPCFTAQRTIAKELLENSVPVNDLYSILLTVIASERCEAMIFELMSYHLYKGAKITAETFNSEEARGDYLEIASEVLKHAIGPFYKNASTLFEKFALLLGQTAKEKSDPSSTPQ